MLDVSELCEWQYEKVSDNIAVHACKTHEERQSHWHLGYRTLITSAYDALMLVGCMLYCVYQSGLGSCELVDTIIITARPPLTSFRVYSSYSFS